MAESFEEIVVPYHDFGNSPKKDTFRIINSNKNTSNESDISTQKLCNQGVEQSNLKLCLVRKDKNSPFLSIQKFIYPFLLDNTQINIKKLWNIYEKDSSHSLIIARHHIDYIIFRSIAEQILETCEPYNIEIKPSIRKPAIRINNSDLIYKNL